jgi:predicted nucleotidyltransferase component of viral defense system
MFYNILDQKRINILPLLKGLKGDFYLAGGTGLALQIGHRDSVDFDFFNEKDIDTKKLFDVLVEIFKEHELLKIQEGNNTLSVLIDQSIKLSFFAYKHKLLNKTIDEECLRLASVEDIGCTKLSAITGRASNKDYIDLYYILHNLELKDLLEKALEKFPNLDGNLILKSLVYFEDIKNEPIIYKNNNHVNFEEVQRFLIQKVKEQYS